MKDHTRFSAEQRSSARRFRAVVALLIVAARDCGLRAGRGSDVDATNPTGTRRQRWRRRHAAARRRRRRRHSAAATPPPAHRRRPTDAAPGRPERTADDAADGATSPRSRQTLYPLLRRTGELLRRLPRRDADSDVRGRRRDDGLQRHHDAAEGQPRQSRAVARVPAPGRRPPQLRRQRELRRDRGELAGRHSRVGAAAARDRRRRRRAVAHELEDELRGGHRRGSTRADGNLVAKFDFDEGTGTTTVDSSGVGAPITLQITGMEWVARRLAQRVRQSASERDRQPQAVRHDHAGRRVHVRSVDRARER